MIGEQVVTTLDRILHWIIRLAVINVLWFAFTLLGLIIGGFFPATLAALGVSRKFIMGERDINIWLIFKEIYTQEFFRSNLLGWFLIIVAGVLYANYTIIAGTDGGVFFLIPFAFYLLVFFYIIVVLWVFPLLAHYNTSLLQHLCNAFIIGLTRLHYTVAICMIIFIVIYISSNFPGIIPFFSISVPAISCMWCSMQIFRQIDTRPA